MNSEAGASEEIGYSAELVGENEEVMSVELLQNEQGVFAYDPNADLLYPIQNPKNISEYKDGDEVILENPVSKSQR